MSSTIVEPKPAPINAGAIRQAMLSTWRDPEYAVLWEVGDATGARHTRFADAVIMSLWPSRGLELHGVEIKVSRNDWLRESAKPRKAEAIAAYCDRWWVHTGPNVIHDLAEVAPAWGWRVWDGKRWLTKREAAKTEAKPCDRTFLAALLRRADRQRHAAVTAAAQAMIEADRQAYEDRVKRDVERRTDQAARAIEQIERFEAASGLKLDEFYTGREAADVGRLVRAITQSGVVRGWSSAYAIVENLRGAADRLDKALAESGLAVPLAESGLGVPLPKAEAKRARA